MINTNHWQYSVDNTWNASLEDYRAYKIEDIHCPICNFIIRKKGRVSLLNWSRDYNRNIESYTAICRCGVNLILV